MLAVDFRRCSARSSPRSSRRSTPDGSVNLDKFRELADATSSSNGSDGARRRRDDGREPDADRRREARALRGRASTPSATARPSSPAPAPTTRATRRTSPSGRTSSASTRSSSSRRTTTSRRSARSSAHFQEIADATDKPVVVYNIPSRVVINIEPETIAELAEIENVRAVKQAHDDLEQARHIAGTRARPLCGRRRPDLPVPRARRRRRHLRAHARLGAADERDGAPLQRDGDVERRAGLNEEMAPAYDLLKIATNPIPIKAALNLLGHDVGGHRLPMVEPTERRARADPRLPRACRRAQPATHLDARNYTSPSWAFAASSRSAVSARSGRT